MIIATYLCFLAAGLTWLYFHRAPASFAASVPTAEVKDSMVLNHDGSLAFALTVTSPIEYTATSTSRLEAFSDAFASLLRRGPDGTILQLFHETSSQVIEPAPAKGHVALASPAQALADDTARFNATLPFRKSRCF